MPQMLQVTVPVEVPKDYVLIDQNKFDQLNSESLVAKMWTMAELRKRLGNKSEKWIKDNTVNNPRYSREIQQMRNTKAIAGGGNGSPWRFQASVIGPWLDKHWKEFNW
ncbi:MAG: DUF771 domain-containing protein [Loigolactobacillus coryniformis]|uniref:DUF771 domain-containing protein n=1 Tax=Loigolactobacillus coryniformis TaxID=1610 RepID=UPI002648D2DC|nr:DUF771 domain-containing protein [Loigolactobacillus coryniformis]MDN5954540.1 DUF771 domain-containing protein [Loigolactobacillus coryniformis]